MAQQFPPSFCLKNKKIQTSIADSLRDGGFQRGKIAIFPLWCKHSFTLCAAYKLGSSSRANARELLHMAQLSCISLQLGRATLTDAPSRGHNVLTRISHKLRNETEKRHKRQGAVVKISPAHSHTMQQDIFTITHRILSIFSVAVEVYGISGLRQHPQGGIYRLIMCLPQTGMISLFIIDKKLE